MRWRPAVGWDGYEVSDCGQVRGVTRVVPSGGLLAGKKEKLVPGRVLVPTKRGGYLAVYPSRNNQSKRVLVHRMVLEAFVGPSPPDAPVCRHINGISDDNRLENLRWGTQKENARDRERHGKVIRGERSRQAKLSEIEVLEIRRMRARGWKLEQIAARFGVHSVTVSKICGGRRWAWLKEEAAQ